MITESVLQIIGLILGGGTVGAVLTYFLGKKKVDSAKDTTDREQLFNEFKILLAERKEITDKLIAENSKLVDKLQKRISDLEKEIKDLKEKLLLEHSEVVSLRNQLLVFESSHVDIPLPMWMKDIKGNMIFLNNTYEDTFLEPRGFTISDYIGKSDYVVWSKEVADNFKESDEKVIISKKPVRDFEHIEDSQGNKILVEVLKYPRMLNNKVIGVSGIILNIDIQN